LLAVERDASRVQTLPEVVDVLGLGGVLQVLDRVGQHRQGKQVGAEEDQAGHRGPRAGPQHPSSDLHTDERVDREHDQPPAADFVGR
jgi:hypothetical protein